MNTAESLGYLKGLLDGLEFDDDTKMFKAIVEVLENIIQDIDDVNEDMDLLAEQVDGIDDDLAEVEDYLSEEEDCGCCGCEDDEYAVTCPACGEEFSVDEDTVMEGGIECPACGEYLEFEIEDEESASEDKTEE